MAAELTDDDKPVRATPPLTAPGRFVPVVVACLLALACPPAAAQEAGDMQAHFGRQTYRLFCAGCHGNDGRGNREVEAALGRAIGDLTRLTRDHGGVFPHEDVVGAIVGTSRFSGHRALALQPWSEMFAEEFERFAGQMAVNELVARRVDHLVEYLRSIQQ